MLEKLNIRWLVIWNMNFIFQILGIIHPDWLSYFSEGLKPPISSWLSSTRLLNQMDRWLRWTVDHGHGSDVDRLVAPLDGGVLGCPGRALAKKNTLRSWWSFRVNTFLGWSPVDVWGNVGGYAWIVEYLWIFHCFYLQTELCCYSSRRRKRMDSKFKWFIIVYFGSLW